MRHLLAVTFAAVVLCLSQSLAAHGEEPQDAKLEPDFVSIFDGRTLDGWRGQDMSFWTIEDGAITGTISPEHAPPMNQYLVYQPELVENFELKLDFRLTGSTTPNTNGGFQFRSRRTPNGDVAGYQIDNNFGQPWKVRIYDEFGRHDLALEGERSRFDSTGKRHVEPLELAPGARDFQLDQWHEYHLTANGKELELRINGKLVAACTDDDPQQFEPAGVLAMQLHTGPPMKAQFRNLRLKRLPATHPRSPREQLFTTAALDYQLGDRVETHQPPLAVHGNVVAGQKSSETSAAFATFDNGWLDAGKDWTTPGEQLTVYLRAKAKDGDWSHALFSKRGGHDRVNFNLFGVDLPNQPGGDVGFEIRTDRGFFQTSFPVASIDAAKWHDLVGRYDGTTLSLYCDGKRMAATKAEGNLVPNAEPLLIGAETEAGNVVRPFRGDIERASLWTKALSDTDIHTLSSGRE
jgi:hypothetical protein